MSHEIRVPHLSDGFTVAEVGSRTTPELPPAATTHEIHP
jgi:hypothetical protein